MRSAVSTVNEVSARALAPSATHATTSAHERSATFADILLGGRSRVLLPDMAPRGRGSAVAWRSGFRGGVEWLDDGSLASRFEASARGKWAGWRIFSCFVAKRASTRNKPCTIYSEDSYIRTQMPTSRNCSSSSTAIAALLLTASCTHSAGAPAPDAALLASFSRFFPSGVNLTSSS